MESTLQEPPWFPARLNFHYRQYEITENNWIILIFIVYLYYIMKNFRIKVWATKPEMVDGELKMKNGVRIDHTIKVEDGFYGLFLSEVNIGVELTDDEWDDMMGIQWMLARKIIKKHFLFEDDEYDIHEIMADHGTIYCDIELR